MIIPLGIAHRVLGGIELWIEIDQQNAFPFASTVPELAAEGVRAVVNTCEEYAGPTEAYEQAQIEQLRIPTVDFTPPTLEMVEQAVEFIKQQIAQGHTVYVHCKAGRGRSATVVACWLCMQLKPLGHCWGWPGVGSQAREQKDMFPFTKGTLTHSPDAH